MLIDEANDFKAFETAIFSQYILNGDNFRSRFYSLRPDTFESVFENVRWFWELLFCERILYCMCCVILSQWSYLRWGVMWWNFGVFVTTTTTFVCSLNPIRQTSILPYYNFFIILSPLFFATVSIPIHFEPCIHPPVGWELRKTKTFPRKTLQPIGNLFCMLSPWLERI